jgi:hypothetical protein
MTYIIDQTWTTEKIQPLAEKLVYNHVWPRVEIIALDDDRQNQLKVMLDVGGADKLLKWPDGGIAFLAQRFRRFDKRGWDDFTIRARRPSGRLTEAGKIVRAFDRSGLVAAYYAYGHVNEDEDGFLRFRIIKFIKFCQLWKLGLLKPDGVKKNLDRSSTFLHWRFSRIPPTLLIHDVKSIRISENP